MTCARARDVEAWARAGSRAALSDELRAHLSSCAVCAARAEDVDAPRRWLAGAEIHDVAAARREEIRFALMSAARTSTRDARPGVRTRRAMWAGALVLVSIAAGASLLVRGGGGGDAASRPDDVAHGAGSSAAEERAAEALAPEPRESLGRIVAEAGARVVEERIAPDEVHRVLDGAARFEVDPLSDGERFRVMAGDATIEVRGTSFRIDVREGLLREVEVAEGEVEVRVGDRTVAHLRTGARWSRADMSASRQAELGPPTTPRAGRTTTAPVEDERVPARADATHRVDREFSVAWRLHREGDHSRAAALLDALTDDRALDAGRRADILYWSARAHLALGDCAAAHDRAARSLATAPNGWYASRAREITSESRCVGASPLRNTARE